MLRILFLAAGLVLSSGPFAAAQTQPAAKTVSTVPDGTESISREARAQARRDCYGENIALSGEDLRRAMRGCMQERFPGVPLYADNGVTRDGKPTATAARAACKEEVDARGLSGSERTAALVACFSGKRPDLAQRAECRKDARGKGLEGAALRAAISDCSRATRS